MNDALRGPRQLELAKRTIHWVAESDYLFQLKVNTQITAINLAQIDAIPDFFMDKVRVWKLLQWTPRADAQKVMDTYAVTPEAFVAIVDQQRRMHPQLTIIDRPYPEPDPDTVIVRPNGDLEVNAGEYDYAVIGNILRENPSDVLQKAGVLYSRLPDENFIEHERSYPT